VTTPSNSFVVAFMEKVLQTVVDEFTAEGVPLPVRRRTAPR
jgi:hypothetical protein